MKPVLSNPTDSNSAMPLKVSLGGGSVKIEDFIRVDIDPDTHPDKIMDARELKFPSQSVEILYASHILEHFKFEPENGESRRWISVVTLLKNWRECLTPTGCLYVSVPDLEKLAKILMEYVEDPDLQKTVMDVVYGGGRSEFDIHYSGFTYNLLKNLLEEAGFQNVVTFDPFVNDESAHTIAGIPISLNLVAYNGTDRRLEEPQKLEDRLTLTDLEKATRIADERRIEILNLSKEIVLLRNETALLMKVCAERGALIDQLDAEVRRLRSHHP